MQEFYLGVHEPAWLQHLDVPLFVSHRRLSRRPRKRPFYRAKTKWALDSGGFTEVTQFGGWKTTAEEYAEAVQTYAEQIGRLQWAAPMDWMCEDIALAATGRDVAAHQELTVSNLCLLREYVTDTAVIPVLQGGVGAVDDYVRCIDLYREQGIDVFTEPVVGIGSVCRIQDTAAAEEIFRELHRLGLRTHGFGLKTQALKRFREVLFSADSLAWSYNARRNEPMPGHNHGSNGDGKCNNCPEWALRWRTRVLAA